MTELRVRDQDKVIDGFLVCHNSTHQERLKVCSKDISDRIQKAWIRDARYVTKPDKVQGLIGDFFEFLATLFICRERPDLVLQMATHALVMSVAYEEGDKKAKETVMRATKWEQNPANLNPDVWYLDDDEFSDDHEISISKQRSNIYS